jgi:hypothetical protein
VQTVYVQKKVTITFTWNSGKELSDKSIADVSAMSKIFNYAAAGLLIRAVTGIGINRLK